MKSIVRGARRVLLLTSVAVAGSCAPATYYLSMQPNQGSGIWQDGHERAMASRDSIQVNMAFVRYDDESLIFDFDIQNQSSKPVLVAPEQFSYSAVNTTLHEGEQYIAYYPGPIKAVNPELKLDKLEMAVAYNLRESNRVMLLASPEYANQTRILHSTVAAQAQTQKEETEKHILRKNTLVPGQGIHGYVYFPRANQADLLRMSLPLRSEPLVIEYKQSRSREPLY
ncbi:hypothetical protein [Hymenobacter jejuensis]|uniref:Uncharacterized protein n=1 Tax=Hymenobacter jejuensis TaxID=2502781 RepID=A0A5B8A1W6_9BACT|nr:hypothetical protein [Hymenobacter jejuensis]QDA61381.1 hypothetical protein FHG12_15315 [Hymenobacter jejuensis]